MHAVAFEAEHAPQAPLGWHAGVAPPQSASAAQARHLFVPVSQTGFVPPHCASLVHERHVPVAASQPGVGPVHFELFVAEHTPHAPLGSHAGVAPAHSLSAAQARHTCAVTSHVGVAPPHCALVRHPTQLPTGTSQTEVAPTQRRALLAEQAPHEPPGWQAGVAPPQSESPAQARHARDVRSHTGKEPPQSASPVQPTHVPVRASQAGIALVHALLFVAEQTPHAPPG
ncbi:MAG TPA: hypothetical protein VMT47_02640 [Polyangia bacterium]|nr:hypothetical protein [Polyangia bacterium]